MNVCLTLRITAQYVRVAKSRNIRFIYYRVFIFVCVVKFINASLLMLNFYKLRCSQA